MEDVRKKSRIWIVAMIVVAMFVTTAVPTFAAAPRKDSVTYLGSGKVEVEFDDDTQYKRLKITVRDSSNKKYKAAIYRTSDDELKFRVKNYKAGKSYRFSISGVREEGTWSYGKVTGSFKIPKADITASKAKSIALKDAGTTASNVRDLDVEKEYDDGMKYYEVTFETWKYDYEYKISLKGKILRKDVERND